MALHTATGSANRKGHSRGQSPAGARWRVAGSATWPICCGHEQRTPQPAGSQGPAVTLSRGRLGLPPSPSSHRYLWPEAPSRPVLTQGFPRCRWASCGLGWPCSWPSCPATACVQAVEAASPHMGDPPPPPSLSLCTEAKRPAKARDCAGHRRRPEEARPVSPPAGTCLCSCSVGSRCPPCRPQRAQRIPPQSSHRLCGKDTLGCPPGTL